MITRRQFRANNDKTNSLPQDEGVLVEDPYFFKEIDFQRKLTVWLKVKMSKSVRQISELLDKPKSHK